MIRLAAGQMAMGIARRQFISMLSSTVVAWPLVARAQQTRRVAQIGFLYPGVAAMTVTRIAALRDGLRAVGYGDAGQVEILTRSSEGDPARLAPLAADLAGRKVDVKSLAPEA
jgi:putative tryptophan/tyrosine transport system substrate-binding protein